MGVFSFLVYHLINTDMKHLVKVFAMLAIAAYAVFSAVDVLRQMKPALTHLEIELKTRDVWALWFLLFLAIVLVMCAISFFDDFLKDRKRRREGLNYKNTF